jgi:hypothetical protein
MVNQLGHVIEPSIHHFDHLLAMHTHLPQQRTDQSRKLQCAGVANQVVDQIQAYVTRVIIVLFEHYSLILMPFWSGANVKHEYFSPTALLPTVVPHHNPLCVFVFVWKKQ